MADRINKQYSDELKSLDGGLLLSVDQDNKARILLECKTDQECESAVKLTTSTMSDSDQPKQFCKIDPDCCNTSCCSSAGRGGCRKLPNKNRSEKASPKSDCCKKPKDITIDTPVE